MTSLATTNPADCDPGMTATVQGNTRFALDLYRQARTAEGNLFLSPYSISAALAMTYAGARGETAAQMARVLCFPPDPRAAHPAFAALRAQLTEAGKLGQVQLNIANSLWPDRRFVLRDDFVALARQYYGAEISSVDYGDPQAAARTINAWVETQTAGVIRDLLSAPMVMNAVLVLVNAIYFKGTWASPFDPRRTQPAAFRVAPTVQVEVETMTKTDRVRYAQDAGVQILALPYTGERVAMILLLPDEIDGLTRLEDSLTPERLTGWIAGARMQQVELFLPRLDIAYSLSLAATLQAMGMKDAFRRADFSGIAEGPLLISDVVHKAAITSNEEGSEAAAATAVVMSRGVPQDWAPPPVVRVDRPFLLLIRENSTGSILFIGRVTDPTPKAA